MRARGVPVGQRRLAVVGRPPIRFPCVSAGGNCPERWRPCSPHPLGRARPGVPADPPELPMSVRRLLPLLFLDLLLIRNDLDPHTPVLVATPLVDQQPILLLCHTLAPGMWSSRYPSGRGPSARETSRGAIAPRRSSGLYNLAEVPADSERWSARRERIVKGAACRTVGTTAIGVVVARVAIPMIAHQDPTLPCVTDEPSAEARRSGPPTPGQTPCRGGMRAASTVANSRRAACTRG